MVAALLVLALLGSGQETEIAATPHDRVVALELAAGRASQTVDYPVEFEGWLHLWTRSAVDARLRVEDAAEGRVLAADAPYARVAVRPGDRLAVSVTCEAAGAVELHLAAAPESPATLAAAAAWGDASREIAATFQRGDRAGARELLAAMVRELLGARGAEHSDAIAGALEELEGTAAALSDPSSARLALERVVAHRVRTLPEDHPDLLRARHYLGLAVYELGDLSRSRELLEGVVAAYGRVPPADPTEAVAAHSNLGVTLHSIGDFAAARLHKERALEAYTRMLPADHPNLLAARDNLSVTIKRMGDHVGARTLQESVVAAYERTLPVDHPDLLLARMNLANTLQDIGDYGGAIEMFEGLLVSCERTFPPGHVSHLTVRMNLGIVKAESGDYDGARGLMEEVLGVLTQTHDPSHPYALNAQWNLATVLSNLGDLASARALQERVLAEYERTLPPDQSQRLAVQRSLAITLVDGGDMPAARALAPPLAAGMQSRMLGSLALAPREVLEMIQAESRRLDAILFLGEGAGAELDVLAFELIETMRAATGEAARSLARSAADPELAPILSEAAVVRGQLNDLVTSASRESIDTARLAEDVAHLSLERDRLERKANRKLAARGVRVQPIEIGSLAAALHGGAAVGYRRFQRLAPDERGLLAAGADHLLAFVLQPGGSLARIDLGPVNELAELVHAWRGSLGAPLLRSRGVAASKRVAATPRVRGGGPRRARNAAEIAAGNELRARILDPVLASAGSGVTRLSVCADDLVHLVPLDALPLDSEGAERVGDRVRVLNEVSFARLLTDARPLENAPSLLVLGGVDYDAELEPTPEATGEDDPRPTEADPFSTLLQTRYEAEAAAHLFEDAFDSEVRPLLRAQTTKATLFEQAPGKHYVHLATHGWFAPESVHSTDDAAPRDRFDRLGMEQSVTGLAPMTLCGLALAGANRGRDALGRVPGILTAEELCSLDLSRCDLAVLSACETNVGIRRAGQGVQSLQAALYAAGARTSLTSLWKVDDAATRHFMELFYTNLWIDKMPKAEALWHAKTTLRDDGAPVWHWAAWVLTGDPD